MSNTNYTYEQIANNYALWNELVDIDGIMSRETFDATPVSELIAMMIEMFGPEIGSMRVTIKQDFEVA